MIIFSNSITFIRPENQTNGISVKSRLLSKLEGKRSTADIAFYGPADESKTETIEIVLSDLGVDLEISSSLANFENYLDLIRSSEVQDNSA